MRADDPGREEGAAFLWLIAGYVRWLVGRVLATDRIAEAALVTYIVSILSMLFLNA